MMAPVGRRGVSGHAPAGAVVATGALPAVVIGDGSMDASFGGDVKRNPASLTGGILNVNSVPRGVGRERERRRRDKCADRGRTFLGRSPVWEEERLTSLSRRSIA